MATRETCRKRTAELQRRLGEADLDAALLTDADSIAYFGAYWNYLGMEFGRPTLMVVRADGPAAIVTPLMESEMCRRMTWVDDVRPWEDGAGTPWGAELQRVLDVRGRFNLGIEAAKTPPAVAGFVGAQMPRVQLSDVSSLIGAMRVVKDADEIAIMRQAGQVAVAMVEAGRAAIAEGVPEYELALAVIEGGTRKAAGFLSDEGIERYFSPVVHNLQVLQSGHDTCMVHRRASVRRIERGDPVYFCFCGIVNFKHFKLGFDREFFVGEVDDEMAKSYETTIAAQQAALDALRPGVAAEDVHAAAAAVYDAAGVAPGYRTGRAIGYSFLESPEIKTGDTTVLQPGMTFAIDGGITVDGRYGTRVGDSVVVTEDGHEVLTPYPKDLTVL